MSSVAPLFAICLSIILNHSFTLIYIPTISRKLTNVHRANSSCLTVGLLPLLPLGDEQREPGILTVSVLLDRSNSVAFNACDLSVVFLSCAWSLHEIYKKQRITVWYFSLEDEMYRR